MSNAIASVRATLPQDIKDPVIAKNDPNAEPTMYIAFSSTTLSPQAVTDHLYRMFNHRFQCYPALGAHKFFHRNMP